MAALILAALLAGTDGVEQWRLLIDRASARFDIPADWIARVMRAESGGRTMLNGMPIRSGAGAIGLMQLMPGTWADMRAAYGLGREPDDPADNILAGTAYLRLLYDRFGYPGLFAAYHAGPARYADTLIGRARLPVATQTYLATLTGRSTQSIPSVAAVPPQTLFAVRYDGISGSPPEAKSVQPASLFAPVGASR
jgi:soluble lytic murein transglycosylase-like protein